jgi:hypothetical protein
MRVQFTKEENEIIDERRTKNETSQDLILPVELQGKVITLGMEVNDVHTFNAFIEQSLKDPKIAEQVGAKIVHVDYREPYNTANILFLQTWINNYINGLVYGPTPEEPVAPVAPAPEAPVAPVAPVEAAPVNTPYVPADKLLSELSEMNSYHQDMLPAFMAQHMDAARVLLPELVKLNPEAADAFIDANIGNAELQSIYDAAVANKSNSMGL